MWKSRVEEEVEILRQASAPSCLPTPNGEYLISTSFLRKHTDMYLSHFYYSSCFVVVGITLEKKGDEILMERGGDEILMERGG
ncbi:hypothetical protein BSKO_06917 [Bryopsis sp. KO-2023]|nr:hypothetical protein BSKO_06917 [Bryopsis sp. KO-2023]